MKVAVMTDSTAYITPEEREKYNIHMVPLSVNFQDGSYREELDITTEEFYQKLANAKELPSTSQPSVGEITKKLEALAEDYDAVITVHLSSGISGTYQTMVSTGEMVDGIDVYAYDSEISCMLQGFYVLEAAAMAQDGADAETIIARMDDMKKSARAYFMVDDLTNLQKGGRLSNAQAILGSLLQIKPILHFEDKLIVPFEKIRTKKKAISRILGMLEEEVHAEKELRVVFIHGNDRPYAEKLEADFKEKHPEIETSISYFGPVIGTHLGQGAIGVAWYEK
ncbi:DegV family protein [Oceanobacillus jeddahense]|uniref:DegV family protein n=1 Tax=Oceanobacillus jeddahense TaxID=1462527 RepID=A0ABY5JPF6_9BACI|nr:DegV family protein [Oceanobacillus jeddahense]UUI02159.1 DegV family protein [Oceanobacillus jeddahense]